MAPKGELLTDTDLDEDTTDDAFEDADLEAGVDDALDGEGAVADEEDDGLRDAGSLLDDDEDVEADAGAGPDRGDGRDDHGKFARTAQEKAADEAAAAAKAAKPGDKKPADASAPKPGATDDKKPGAAPAAVVADDKKPAADATPPAKWEPYTVRADKQLFPIDGAIVTKVNGVDGQPRMLIAVPEKQFQQFGHRIARGIAAERRWRDIVEREQQLEFQAKAPKAPSDSEIEAKIMLEAIKPLLPELFDAQAMENLELKIKNAQLTAKTEFATAEEQRRGESVAGSEWEKTQWKVLVDEAFELVETQEDLKGMDPKLVEEVLREDAGPFRDKLVFKENGEVLMNNEALFRMLKRAKLAAGGTTAPPAPAAAPAPAKAGTPGAADKPTDGDRFNAGQDTAAKPGTTSLKAGRDKGAAPARRQPPSPRNQANERTDAQAAEDKFRKLKQRMNRSDTLDFEDDDDGEDST